MFFSVLNCYSQVVPLVLKATRSVSDHYIVLITVKCAAKGVVFFVGVLTHFDLCLTMAPLVLFCVT